MGSPDANDHEVNAVGAGIRALDPDGKRTAQVLRDTFDQLYDGQRTGRYRWDRLYKTEKTHCGTLVEINLQREFDFKDGPKLDYEIAGVDVDCKYSQNLGGLDDTPRNTRPHLPVALGGGQSKPHVEHGTSSHNP